MYLNACGNLNLKQNFDSCVHGMILCRSIQCLLECLDLPKIKDVMSATEVNQYNIC